MKYLYKKHKKKLLILFFLLPAALVTIAQIPGTPYGLTALSPATIPSGSGSFAGRTCFDVAQVNDAGECGNLISRKNETLTANGSRADFSNTITRNQTYTFTPSGTVSNVRFYFVEASPYEGQIIESMAGGNPGNNITSSTPVTCNMIYKSDLNGKAEGKTNANALTVDIYAVYNDNGTNTGTDKSVKLTAMIRDCACCGAYTTSGSWLSFMCYNLGADPTLTTPDQIKNAPTSRTYGYYYQWGKRKAWASSGSVSGWSTGNNTNIDGAGGNSNNNAWGQNGGKTEADPCPTGFRVPSASQLKSLFKANMDEGIGYPLSDATANPFVWENTTTTRGMRIGNFLFLPAAGYRGASSSAVAYAGSFVALWSRDAYGNWESVNFEMRSLSISWCPEGCGFRYMAHQVRCVVE